jgi:hypothetical protein
MYQGNFVQQLCDRQLDKHAKENLFLLFIHNASAIAAAALIHLLNKQLLL